MFALTTDFNGESRKASEVKDTLARIARAGFSHIHWCHEWTGYYIYSIHEMHQIREWCDELGLKVCGVHASMGDKNCDLKHYTSSNEYNRLAGVELIKNRIDLTGILDAKEAVLHLPVVSQLFDSDIEYREQFIRCMLRSFDELEDYCKTLCVRICIENLNFSSLTGHHLFKILFDRYDCDYMGLCFDTGHALMSCKNNFLEYAETYNDRLFMIHVHDNYGETDDHLIPFDGNFDWDGFAPVLARSPCKYPLLIESSCKSYPNPVDEKSWLEKTYLAGCRFSEMADKFRV